MANVPIQKIFPSPEELSSICSKVKCPQEQCTAVFQCSSNLNMHLIKHHKLSHSGLTARTTETHYFCPAEACPYHRDSKKHFTKLKYLKQHFLKVHASKEFVCKKCDKKFSTNTFRSLHMKNCGKLFTCTCGIRYTSSEAILTHCKRKGKGHEYVGKNEKDIKNPIVNGTQKNDNNNVKKTERFIYPKLTNDLSFPIHNIAAIALSELSVPCVLSKSVDRGIQTEMFDFDFNKDLSLKCVKKRKHSQQTQTTGKFKKLKISTQTQTNSDFLNHKGKGHPKSVLRKRKKSMETQTKDHARNDGAKVNPFNEKKESGLLILPVSQGQLISKAVNKDQKTVTDSKSERRDTEVDEEKARKWLWEIVSPSSGKSTEHKGELFNMSTELNLYSDLNQNSKSQYGPEQSSDSQIFDLNRLCNIETQTEIDALLTECNEDTTFTLCSTTETQTTDFDEDDGFDSLLYSNMCTQTCEEVDQLFNFNFVHIETQTAWPDLNDCQDLDKISLDK